MTDCPSNRTQRRPRSPFVLAALVMFAFLHAAQPAAAAGPPSPANSTMPGQIKVVGTADGVADPDGAFTVTVRDADNLTMSGVTVTFDVSNTDVGFATNQPLVTYVACKQVSAITDQNGVAFFNVVGGVINQTGNWSPTSIGTITAGSTLLGPVNVAAFDLDGVDGSTLNDFHLMYAPFFSAINAPVMDYDNSGYLGINDFSLSLSHIFGSRSIEPQSLCGNASSGAVFATGKLPINLAPDCLTGSASAFCSGTNTSLVFKVTSPVALTNVTSMMVEFDVIGPVGVPLTPFWRFQSGGCHSSGIQLIVPDGATESCYDGSAIFTDPGDLTTIASNGGLSASYPGPSGLPNEERVRLAMVTSPRYVGPGVSGPACTFGYGNLPSFGADVAFALRIRNTTTCTGCATAPAVKLRLNSITFTSVQPADPGYSMAPKDCPDQAPQRPSSGGSLAGMAGALSARGTVQPSTFVVLPDGSGDNIIATDGSTTDVTPPSGSTSALWLAAAAPNPTSAGTQLAFSLPNSQHVQLAIVDVAGRMVRVIADGPLGAGGHRVGWDGNDASGARARAGVYYCRLLTGGERRSTTIVLTR